MQWLLAVAFALLLIGELALLALLAGALVFFPYLLWQRSPLQATLAVGSFVAIGIAIWRSQRDAPPAPEPIGRHPGISISHIPVAGPVGAIYMIQFLVWAIVSPEIGLFYAALIAGALLLLPFLFHAHRRRGESASSVGLGGLLGALCGLGTAAFVAQREFPLARVFAVALGAGVLGAPILLWYRGRRSHVSIAPYADAAQPQPGDERA